MTRLLLKKTIHESALLFFACGLMLFVFCWARVWLLTQFDLKQFEVLLDQLRPFEKFMPIPIEQLLTYRGSLAMTFEEPVLILCILVWSIARGSDVVSGEINRGTLEMLLAQPIGRLRLLVCHASVCTTGLALLCLLSWLGLAAGIHTNSVKESVAPTIDLKLPFVPFRIPLRTGPVTQIHVPLAQRVDATAYVAPACNLFGLGFFVFSLSMLCSSFDRYRWRTLGIVIGIYVIQLLMLLLSKATAWTSGLGYFTFLAAYKPVAIVHVTRNSSANAWRLLVPPESLSASWQHSLGPLGLTVLLIAMGLACLAIAAWIFRTRDIPAPL